MVPAELQPATGPEQPPGVFVQVQGDPALGTGVVADQLCRPGQAPAAAGGNRCLTVKQQTSAGVTAEAGGHLQSEDIDDLDAIMSARNAAGLPIDELHVPGGAEHQHPVHGADAGLGEVIGSHPDCFVYLRCLCSEL